MFALKKAQEAMAKVTETFKLLLDGKSNQYVRFAAVVDELTQRLEKLTKDAKDIKDPTQLRPILDEIKSAMQNIQIQARKLDEHSAEKNSKIRQKIGELEEKLRKATNELAIQYDALTKTAQFQTVKEAAKAEVVKPDEQSLDDLLGCIDEEASNALGTVNFKPDLLLAETAAKELQQSDPTTVTVEQVADVLTKTANAEASRQRALKAYEKDLAAAPNMQSSLLTKARNVGGFRDLIRTGLEKIGLKNLIQKAKENGNIQGIAQLQTANTTFKEKTVEVDQEIKVLAEPEKLKNLLSPRQQELMYKVNNVISHPELPKKLKDLIAEMAGRIINVLAALEKISTIDPETKKVQINGKLNKSDLFGLAQIYSDYCDFYVAGHEIRATAMGSLLTLNERRSIGAKYQADLEKTGYEALLLDLRDRTLVPIYNYFEPDIREIVGPQTVIKCVQDMIDAWKLYENICVLTELDKQLIQNAKNAIEVLQEQKKALSQQIEKLEAEITTSSTGLEGKREDLRLTKKSTVV